jgi:hypothetical protein
MKIEGRPSVLAVENLGTDERHSLLKAIEEMLVVHHEQNWSTKVDYAHVDYMQTNILGPALAKDVNVIVSDLNKEATLADLDYLFLLYETIENDAQKKALRRGDTIKPITLEPLPMDEVDIEALLLDVFTYCKADKLPTENITLPEISSEVKNFIEDTTAEDLSLLVREEINSLRSNVGGVRKPTHEFWHMVDKIKNSMDIHIAT